MPGTHGLAKSLRKCPEKGVPWRARLSGLGEGGCVGSWHPGWQEAGACNAKSQP